MTNRQLQSRYSRMKGAVMIWIRGPEGQRLGFVSGTIVRCWDLLEWGLIDERKVIRHITKRFTDSCLSPFSFCSVLL